MYSAGPECLARLEYIILNVFYSSLDLYKVMAVTTVRKFLIIGLCVFGTIAIIIASLEVGEEVFCEEKQYMS